VSLLSKDIITEVKKLLEAHKRRNNPFIALSTVELPLDTKRGIAKALYDFFISEAKRKLEEKKENEIWISDLVLCPLRTELREMYPELSLIPKPNLLLGSLVHLGIRFIAAACGLDYEVPISKEISINGKRYILKGRIDLYSPDDNILWELKTARETFSIPHPHHILQVYLYKIMVNAEEARIIYVAPDRVCEVPVSEADMIVAMGKIVSAEGISERKLIETLVDIHINKKKVPLWDWECEGYCPFRQFCPRYVKKVRGK